jgi:Arc-like DNA binding domain
MARRKPADTVHLRLRFPEKLRRRVEAAAGKNQQSMNAEIVERLDCSFSQEDVAATIRQTVEAMADAVAERIVLASEGRVGHPDLIDRILRGEGPDLTDRTAAEVLEHLRKKIERLEWELAAAKQAVADIHGARRFVPSVKSMEASR